MRFTIATATILSQVLPASTTNSGNHVNTLTLSRNLGVIEKGQIRALLDKASPRLALLAKQSRKVSFTERVSNGQDGILKNINKEQPTGKACDPTSNDPDIGILSCPPRQFCVESSSSNLGGVCASVQQDRSLTAQAALPCIDASFPYTCDCQNFDTTTFSGPLKCVVNPYYCVGCTDYCMAVDVNFVFDSFNVSSVTYCYYFKKPYQIDLCYTYDAQAGTCVYTVNGVNCNACVFGTCNEFDCTNIPKGMAGTCKDPALPIISALDKINPNATCAPKHSGASSLFGTGGHEGLFSPSLYLSMTTLATFVVGHFLIG